MILTEKQVQTFHETGYLNEGIRVLSEEQTKALRDRLYDVMAGKSASRPEAMRNLNGGGMESDKVVVQIVNIWEADDLFRAHLCHPIITSIISQLSGAETIRVWHDQIQYKPPFKGTLTGWHQDYPAWPILEPSDLISCWVALEDATVENGCMRMVPRSHRWGIHRGMGTGPNFELQYDASQIPDGERVEIVPMEVPAGCAAFHHCLTWHGSPSNPSPKPRPAIAVHYMPGYTRFTPKGHHLIEHRVEVEPGEVLIGDYFPTVYENNEPISPERIKIPDGPPPNHDEFLDFSYA